MQETWAWSLGWEDPLDEEQQALQCSGLENSMDRGARGAAVYGVAQSGTHVVASVVSDSVRPHGQQAASCAVHRTLEARTLEWVVSSFSIWHARK